jgi:tight adherence protein C
MRTTVTLLVSLAASVVMALRARAAWSQLSGTRGSGLAGLGAILRPKSRKEIESLRVLLVRAGMRGEDAVEVFVAARLLCWFAGGVLSLLLLVHGNILFAPLVGILAVLAPGRYLKMHIAARHQAIERSLPPTIDLLTTCIDAGLSLEHAVARVARELDHGAPELAEELIQVEDELDAGLAIAEAMRRLGKRVALEELESLCAVIGQASALGARVGDTLREYASAARRRRMALMEEKAGKVGASLALPLTVCLMPASIIVMLGPAVVTIIGAFGGK